MRLTSVGGSVDTLLKTEMLFVHGYPGNNKFLDNHILNETSLNLVIFACE